MGGLLDLGAIGGTVEELALPPAEGRKLFDLPQLHVAPDLEVPRIKKESNKGFQCQRLQAIQCRRIALYRGLFESYHKLGLILHSSMMLQGLKRAAYYPSLPSLRA